MFTLRLAFLAPAIADFLLAFLALYGATGIVDDSLLPRLQFASAAFCWGILLLVGLAQPIQRAWILVPTALVIGGIGVAYFAAFATGNISLLRLLLAAVLCATMIWLCLAGAARASHHQIGDGHATHYR